MIPITNIVYGFVTVFVLTLLIISILAYRRTHEKKLLFLSVAFAIFFIKSIVQSIYMFHHTSNILQISSIFDAMFLSIMYFAVLKK